MSRGIATRRQRRASRSQVAQLSLVSLMDIFTILVFFLLVNVSGVEVLPAPRDMVLPESTAETRASQAPVLLLTGDLLQLHIAGQAWEVMRTDDIDTSTGPLLPELVAAFAHHLPPLAEGDATPMRGELNIMADRDIAYARLRRILATASDAGFTRLSLAVAQRSGDGG